MVTAQHHEDAGRRYAAAVDELLAAFAELAAVERLMPDEGPGPKANTFAAHAPLAHALVLAALRHRRFAPNPPKPAALREMIEARRLETKRESLRSTR